MIKSPLLRFSFLTVIFFFTIAAVALVSTSKVEASGWGWSYPTFTGSYSSPCGSPNNRIYAQTQHYQTGAAVNAGSITVEIRKISDSGLVATLSGITTTSDYNCFNISDHFLRVKVNGNASYHGYWAEFTDGAPTHQNKVILLHIYVVPVGTSYSTHNASPGAAWFNTSSVTVTGNVTTLSPTYGATCVDTIWWRLNGAWNSFDNYVCKVGNFTHTFTGLSDGSYTWDFVARDNACSIGCIGKISGISSDFDQSSDSIFYVDINDPFTVTASHSPVSPLPTQNVTVTGSSADGYSGIDSIEIFVDGISKGSCSYAGFFGPGSANCSINTGMYAQGTSHNYYAKACDKAGNCRNSTTKTFTVQSTGTIQGYKVLMPGNRNVLPASSQTVDLDGGSPTTLNPYVYNFVPVGNHTISVTVPPNYTVGYTLCYNVTGCHNNPPSPGSSVVVNVPAGGYADLWWHYTRKAWFQTRGGDVGTFGSIGTNAAPFGERFTTYLAIANSSIDSTINSLKGWIIKNYIGGIDLKPAPIAGSIYTAMADKYKINSATAINNLNNITSTGVYKVSGSGTLTIPGGGFNYNKSPAIVFVPQNLNINGNLTTDPDTGLVLVVNRRVSINSNVRTVEAVLVFDEDFVSGSGDEQLKVSGAAIGAFKAGNKFNLGRDLKKDCSLASCNENTPGELFVYEPKYLWLFRGLLGEPRILFEEVIP